jgi:hypothetical protein
MGKGDGGGDRFAGKTEAGPDARGLTPHPSAQIVVARWSMHPVIGPRLISGEWYNEDALPAALQVLYREAQVPMEGVDFEWRLPGDGKGAAGRSGGGGGGGGGERA